MTPKSITRNLLPALLAGVALLAPLGCTPDEGAIGGNRGRIDLDAFGNNSGDTDEVGDVSDESDAAPDVPEPDVVEDQACVRNGDCTDADLCVFHRDDPNPPLLCGDAAGGGSTGDPCSADSDCRSGLCLDGRCADPCGSDADCPDGFRCESREVIEGVTLDVCVPDECQALNECSGDDVCQAMRGEGTLEFTCREADNPDGGAVGEVCTSDAECLTNFCEGGRCSAPCGDAADCAADLPLDCETVQVPVGNGSVEASICTGPPACDQDSDCEGAEVCFVRRAPADLELYCDPGNTTTGGQAPDLCATDADCLHGLCLNGQCAEPCVEGADCAAGLTCAMRTVTLQNGNASINVCVLPAEDACIRDADCPGEVCAANRRNDRIDFTCGAGNPGGGDAGDPCGSDAECLNNLCLDGACAPPCGIDNDCDRANGEICTTQQAQVGNGGQVNVSVCTFPEPCQAVRQCSGAETCYVRDVGATEIETVCLPPNQGGRDPGAACTDDDQCRTNLCLTDWLQTACSAPCEVNTDCPDGWSCQPRDLRGTPDSRTSVCVPPDPTPCQANTDCSGLQVCSVVVNRAGDGLDAVCINPVGPGGNEVACTTDANCRTGVCLDGFCSALCRDRLADCGPNSLCLDTDITRGGQDGSFNLCNRLPDQACDANDQCADGVRVCGDIRSGNPTEPYCIWPEEDGDPIGTPCTGTRSPNNQCHDRICLTPFTNECTTTCVDNQDCADADAPAGYICTDFRLGANADTVRMCALGCQRDGFCTRTGFLCGLSRNVTDDRFEFICRSPQGDDPIGTDCSQTVDCDHGICLIRRQNNVEVERVCTQPCETNADCPTSWTCGDASIARPGSGSSQTLRVCTRTL